MTIRIGVGRFVLGSSLVIAALASLAADDNTRGKALPRSALTVHGEAPQPRPVRPHDRRTIDHGDNEHGRGGRIPLPPPTFANLVYGPHWRNTLDLWLPEGGAGPCPIAVYFHGGGFAQGDKGLVPTVFVERLREAGIAVASADYRLSSDAPFPAPMQDGAAALEFLGAQSGRLGLDPARLLVFGTSAGGGLAQWLAFQDALVVTGDRGSPADRLPRIRGVLAISSQTTYEPDAIGRLFDTTDLPWFLVPFLGASTLQDLKMPTIAARGKAASPVTYYSADDPPVCLAYRIPDDPLPPDPPPNAYIHHPRFARLLEEKARDFGGRIVVRAPDPGRRTGAVSIDDEIEFIAQTLSVGR